MILWLFMGSASLAQTLTENKSDSGSALWGGAWLGMVMLVLLLGLVALVLWLYRTFNHRNTSSAVEVLAAHTLGPRDRILIVRIEDRILALGQTASQINLLTELDSFTPQTSAMPGDASGFAHLVQQFVRRSRP